MSQFISKQIGKVKSRFGRTDGSQGQTFSPIDDSKWEADFRKFDGKNFSRKFVLSKKAGKAGAYAAVFSATPNVAPSHGSSKMFTVKRIKRRSHDKNAGVMEEVRILRAVQHPNVVKFYQFFQDAPDYFYIVTEHMAGGELFDRIAQKVRYNEEEARDVCYTLLSTVKHIHDQDVAHCDLKPSNMLLSSPSDDGAIKIADFSLARTVANGPLNGKCGTPHFVAPEILRSRPHGKPVDMWSMGVIVYTVLAGYLPFKAVRQSTLFRKIQEGKYKFHDYCWVAVSTQAKDLITKLLVVDQSRRITATEAINHPWFDAPGESLATRDLGHNLDELKVFNAKRKLRAAIRSVLAASTLLGSLTGCQRDYVLGRKLGQGAFATVFQATVRGAPADSQPFAIKRTAKRGLKEEDRADLFQEVRILGELEHPNVVGIYQFYDDDPDYYYMVLEFMAGGELFGRIVDKEFYNEEEARDLCRYLLKSIEYCHGQGVVHRDLKPENLLLAKRGDDTSVKLADFGFACSVRNGKLTQGCGTPGYVAPEILKGIPYDTSVDMWSIGVIIYIILAGYPPFNDENQTRLFRKIKAGNFKFHEEYWGSVSKEAKDLIRNLLVVDTNKRMSATKAIRHPWLQVSGENLKAHDLGNNQNMLRVFNAKRKLRAAVKTVMLARSIMSNPIMGMMDELDSD